MTEPAADLEALTARVERWTLDHALPIGTGALLRDLLAAVEGLQARAQAAEAEVTRLREALVDAHQQLRYLWEQTRLCPCGARAESLATHPHMPGCPTAAALAPDEGRG